MIPKLLVLLSVADPGPLKLGWLKVLKESHRNFKCCFSDHGTWNDFVIPISTLKNPGPWAALRLPTAPANGKFILESVAVGSAKYCRFPLTSVWMPVFSGPVTTAGASSVKSVGNAPVLMVNGYPVRYVTIPLQLQPPMKASSHFGASCNTDRPRPTGKS